MCSKGHHWSRINNKRCPICQKEKSVRFYEKNPIYDKVRYLKNAEKQKEYGRIYRKNNPTYVADYQRKKKKESINFRLSHVLRSRLRGAILRKKKVGSAVQDLGCTVAELKSHLESLWQPGMDWASWEPKGWHIDHIKPLSRFDLTDREQFLKACHYTNLQPLWAERNWKKGSKSG